MKKQYIKVFAYVVIAILVAQFFTTITLAHSSKQAETYEHSREADNSFEFIAYKSNLNFPKNDAEIIEDYGSYALIKSDMNDYRELKRKGLVIDKQSSIIQTVSGKVDLNEWSVKREELKSNNVENQYLLQFIGPVKQEWIDTVQKNEISIYENLGSNTYIVKGKLTDVNEISEKLYVKDIYQYKPSFKISSELENTSEKVELKLDLIKQTGRFNLIKTMSMLGGKVLSYNACNLNYDSATVEISSSKIEYLARNPSVVKIYEKPEYTLHNELSSWVMQSYDKEDKTETVWDKGILGQNQVIGIADTGIDYDHAMFRNSSDEIGEPGPSHRKIVLYKEYADGSEADYSGHGTHVSGSAAGDWKNYGEPDGYDGMAPSAKIAFFDVGNGDSLDLPDDLTTMYQTQYDSGSRIFSNSWGSSSSSYTTDSENTDKFMWNHNDALILFANGNSGPDKKTVGSPATAKNIVSVGNSINGISEDMAESSSHGPTDEGRLKPTISAPGTDIISADSDGSPNSMNSGLMSMTGTSMATPIAAGLSAQIRQYYTEGWLNNGEKDTNQGIDPSGSLMKATLINSAWNMEGDYTGKSIPSHGQGWGKLNLDRALYFKGDNRKLSVLNDGTENGNSLSNSGDCDEYSLFVEDEEDLKITLTWTDYPGAALQNDLNLVVEAPDGKQYIGNVFQNGHSVQGGNADNINVSEQVYLDVPQVQSGRYTIKVIGNTISESPQKYSLIATGDISRSTGDVSFLKQKYNLPPAESEAMVRLMDTDKNQDPSFIDTSDVTVYSTTEPAGESITVQETGNNTGIFTGSIPLGTGSALDDGILQVSENDILSVEYFDSSNSVYRSSEAVIDTEKPKLKEIKYPSIEENNILSDKYEINWETDEKTYGSLYYGKTRNLDKVVRWDAPSYNHSTVLKNLEPNTTYYFKIIASDTTKTPNLAILDNNGAYYTFKTPNTAESIGEGYSGYTYSVSNGTDQDSIFDRNVMFSGYYYTMTFFGTKEGHFNAAVMFDTSSIKGMNLSDAEIQLFPKSMHMPTHESESWKFEILNDSIESAFPAPSHTTLSDADVQFTVDSIKGSNLADADKIDTISVDESDLSALEDNIADGKVVMRMRLPNKTKHINLNGWYTAHQIKRDSFLFKSPSLIVQPAYKEEGYIELDRGNYTVDDFAQIRVEDDGMNLDSESIDTAEVTVSSYLDSKTTTLIETGKDTSVFIGHIELSEDESSEDILKVNDGDTISVNYINSLDNKISDESVVENDPPSVSNLQIVPKNDLTCKVSWDTDEPTTSIVKYGSSNVLTREKYHDDLSTHHEVILTDLVEDTQYNIEVAGHDDAGNSIDNTGIQHFTTPSSDIQPSILVIEDDGDAQNYRTALENKGYDYTFEHVSASGLPSSDLNNFDITVWIIDGFSDTLTLEERKLIKDYLEDGGNLYINGEDIGYDIGDSNFYLDYLHSNYIQGYSDSSIINGLSGDPVSDGLTDLEIGGKYADVIEPMGESSSVVFNYGTGSTAGIKAKTEDYKLVYMGCEYFEGPDGQTDKDSLMENIVSWMDPNQVDDVGPSIGIIDEPSGQIELNETVTIESRAEEYVSGGSNVSVLRYYTDVAGSSEYGNICEPVDGQYDSKLEDVSISIDAVELGVGEHVIYFRGEDNSGNWGKYEKVSFKIVDSSGSTLPSVQITSPDDNEIFSNDSVEVQWTGDGEWYETKLDDRDWQDVGSSTRKIYEGLTDGTHHVYVRAYNNESQSTEDSVSFTVDTTDPIAKAGEDRTVNVDESVTFDGSNSSDNIGITDHIWIIEGAEYHGEVATYSFDSEGTYNVILSVEDEAGNIDTDSVNITVESTDEPPTAEAGEDRTVSLGDSVTIDGSSSTDDYGIENYTWSIEDSQYYGVTVDYVFSDIGTYKVTLTVTDTSGNEDTDSVNITVEDTELPTADAGKDKFIDMGETVTFNGSGSSDNHKITEYRWTIEGSYKYGQAVDHSFTDAGEYQVTLKVTDESGNYDTDIVNVSVEDTEKPVADAGEDRTAMVEEKVTFDGSGSTDNVGIDSYTWTIEDETYQGKTVDYYFENESEYVVTLNVSDYAGNYDTDTVIITVNNDDNPPVADAGEDRTVSYGEIFILDASGSYDDNGIVNYTWFLEDGAFYGKITNISIEKLGTYPVTLEVEDSNGQKDSDTVNITIIDDEKPTADAGSDKAVDEDTVVNFSGSDSSDNVGIVNYTWIIEDLEYYGEEVTHTFEQPGDYIVELNVTDETGNRDTDTVNVTVLDFTDPVADAGDDKTVDEDTVVTFNGSGSSDNVGIVEYEWTIEGSKYYGEVIEYEFTEPGTYDVTLTVKDDAGNIDSDTITVTVEDQTAPTADAGEDRTVDEDEEITFDGSASTDNVGIVSYTWTINGETKTGEEVTYTFTEPGEYQVTLNVTDEAGNWDTDTITVTVRDVTAPSAVIKGDTEVDEDTTVTFNASNSSDNVRIADFKWTIEDSELSGEEVSHIFKDPGNYIVKLKVTDPAGNYNETSIEVTANDITPPMADAGEDKTVYLEDTITLNGSGSSDNVNIVNYTWDIENNEYHGKTIQYKFSEIGSYEVFLTVKDEAGNIDRDVVNVTVEREQDTKDPVAVAGEDRTVFVGEEVNFDGSESYDDEGIVNYYWDLDDGQYTTGMNVNHTYNETGIYRVMLGVVDAEENYDSDIVNITVESKPSKLEADAGKNITAPVYESVTLDASNSTSNYDIVRYEWQIDSEEYLGETIEHQFTEPEIYEIHLTVTDASGSQDDDSISVEIVDNQDPKAVITVEEVVPLGKPVMINGENSTDNCRIINYTWTIDERVYYGPEIEHTFEKPGRETINLAVIDGSGNFDETEVKVLVKDKIKPKAHAGNEIITSQGEFVTLDGSESTDNYKIENYTWIIEGEEYYGEHVEYNFTETGNYTVQLIVKDTAGNVDSDEIMVKVRENVEVNGFPILLLLLSITIASIIYLKEEYK
ncbi:MAG: PKD domain-containing protein [Thermoplasmata archaeon]